MVHSGTCSHNCYHYDGILYIFGKAIFFSIHRCKFYFNRLEIIGFFYFYFFNMDFSVNICVMNLKFSVWVLKVPLEGSMSNLSLRPYFLFYVKKRVTFCYFLKCKFLHFIK